MIPSPDIHNMPTTAAQCTAAPFRRYGSDEITSRPRQRLSRAEKKRQATDDSDLGRPAKRRTVRIQAEPERVVEPEVFPDFGDDDETLTKEQCWYTRNDLVSSRVSARNLSREIRSDTDPLLSETYDMACQLVREPELFGEAEEALSRLHGSQAFWHQRGLERYAETHSAKRGMQIYQVKSAVLMEQMNQMLNGESNPEQLALRSFEASLPSQHFAQMLALADEAMARRIHSEPQPVETPPTQQNASAAIAA